VTLCRLCVERQGDDHVVCVCGTESGEDDYIISCLLMVFIAVALPRLARTDNTSYKAALEGTYRHI